MRNRIAFVLFTIGMLAPLAAPVAGAEFQVAPDTELKPLLKQVAAGDTLILSDGMWRDVDLRFDQLMGTADRPIHIRAESPGKVVFTGKSTFGLSGQACHCLGSRLSQPAWGERCGAVQDS